MGLFDKLMGGKTDAPFTVQEAVAAVLFLTVAADGDIGDEEKDLFISISNRMKLLKNQNAEQFNEMIRKIRGQLDAHGFDGVLKKAAAIIPDELAQATFTNAADIAFADGSVDENEALLLEAIQIALKVSDNFAQVAADVMRIKNSA